MTSSSTCWQSCAISSEAEAVGRSQATVVSKQSQDRSAVPTSAWTADEGIPTQLRQHLLASSWKFSPRQHGTSIRSASLKNTSLPTAWSVSSSRTGCARHQYLGGRGGP